MCWKLARGCKLHHKDFATMTCYNVYRYTFLLHSSWTSSNSKSRLLALYKWNLLADRAELNHKEMKIYRSINLRCFSNVPFFIFFVTIYYVRRRSLVVLPSCSGTFFFSRFEREKKILNGFINYLVSSAVSFHSFN